MSSSGHCVNASYRCTNVSRKVSKECVIKTLTRAALFSHIMLIFILFYHNTLINHRYNKNNNFTCRTIRRVVMDTTYLILLSRYTYQLRYQYYQCGRCIQQHGEGGILRITSHTYVHKTVNAILTMSRIARTFSDLKFFYTYQVYFILFHAHTGQYVIFYRRCSLMMII